MKWSGHGEKDTELSRAKKKKQRKMKILKTEVVFKQAHKFLKKKGN